MYRCRQSVLVSATLHSKLGAVAEELLSDPVAVGLEIQRDAAGNVALLDTGPPVDSFQLPKNLQQLYMDVPVKMRMPVLLGAIYGCLITSSKASGGAIMIPSVAGCVAVLDWWPCVECCKAARWMGMSRVAHLVSIGVLDASGRKSCTGYSGDANVLHRHKR